MSNLAREEPLQVIGKCGSPRGVTRFSTFVLFRVCCHLKIKLALSSAACLQAREWSPAWGWYERVRSHRF